MGLKENKLNEFLILKDLVLLFWKSTWEFYVFILFGLWQYGCWEKVFDDGLCIGYILICKCINLHMYFLYAYLIFLFDYFFLVEQVVSPFPPSEKIGIKSVQRESEEILPMKQMKMDWVPYIPLEDRYESLFSCLIFFAFFVF